eukprot:scaffold107181_cov42-Phaeocystis_antarctica.AAC.1
MAACDQTCPACDHTWQPCVAVPAERTALDSLEGGLGGGLGGHHTGALSRLPHRGAAVGGHSLPCIYGCRHGQLTSPRPTLAPNPEPNPNQVRHQAPRDQDSGPGACCSRSRSRSRPRSRSRSRSRGAPPGAPAKVHTSQTHRIL